jgi:hypothetical protein
MELKQRCEEVEKSFKNVGSWNLVSTEQMNKVNGKRERMKKKTEKEVEKTFWFCCAGGLFIGFVGDQGAAVCDEAYLQRSTRTGSAVYWICLLRGGNSDSR